jgi:RTX calcium-binding nonapeptide repeat (4 copies)
MRAGRDRLGSEGSRYRRGALALAAAVTLLLCLGQGTASTQGTVVLFGAPSGSTLHLDMKGTSLIAEGRLARTPPQGCHVLRRRTRANCPLGDAGMIEVDMGPSGDRVEVLDRLPLPLTVHLGAGSDKFIGNGENDTCYSEGSRRNRCVGGAGNDICITGDQNSDCVGGPGNDYCQTGAGSDGCWGGPGDDICRMGAGEDGCHGEGGNDQLYGGPNADRLYGGAGDDSCDGLPGRGRSEECEGGPGD